MKPLGTKKIATRVSGHQRCAVCHPKPKGGRAAARREAYEELALEAACIVAELGDRNGIDVSRLLVLFKEVVP